MNYESTNTQSLPFAIILAFILLMYLVIEVLVKWKKRWAIPAILTYGTIGMWYFTEIIYTPEVYISFPPNIVEFAFIQVIVFLLSFRLFVPCIVDKFSPKKFNSLPTNIIMLKPDRLLYILAGIWALLLTIGLSQANWDITGVLFPLGSRSGSVVLFSRAAIGGSFDFLVSTASYIYNLICSLFGVTVFFQKKINAKIMNISLMIISWPMFVFLGTRNALLFIIVPFCLTYLFVSNQKIWVKLLVASLGFVVVNYLMTIMIAFRNVGFEDYLSRIWEQGIVVPENKHDGLNMAEELFYINSYLDKGIISISYGNDYLIDILNFIPRGVWADKPFIGLEYAQLRAPGSGDSGISATISRGLIGGGVMNFGTILGPIAPAFLMASWSGILARFWQQRTSILRFSLFLVGLGVTPNLGRDFTLLVLWPIVFGYLITLYLERREQKKRRFTTS